MDQVVLVVVQMVLHLVQVVLLRQDLMQMLVVVLLVAVVAAVVVVVLAVLVKSVDLVIKVVMVVLVFNFLQHTGTLMDGKHIQDLLVIGGLPVEEVELRLEILNLQLVQEEVVLVKVLLMPVVV
jgi:hypothetical protein